VLINKSNYQGERRPVDRSIPAVSAAAAQLLAGGTSQADEKKNFLIVVASNYRFYTAQNNIAFIKQGNPR